MNKTKVLIFRSWCLVLVGMGPTGGAGAAGAGAQEPHVVVLDGGFSTQLSCHVGHVIDGDPLWSARFLHTHPNEVLHTHLDFLRGTMLYISLIKFNLVDLLCNSQNNNGNIVFRQSEVRLIISESRRLIVTYPQVG